jgi:hypothetical protein
MTKPVKHHGAVTVAVLVCLAVVMMLIASTLQASLRMRQEVRTHKQRLQAEYLCDAGFLRAEKKLLQNAGYEGEDWSPELPDLPGLKTRIIIRIQESESDSGSQELVVTASVVALGVDPLKSVQGTKKRAKP